MFGGPYTEIILTGDTFDDCQQAALAYAKAEQKHLFTRSTIPISSKARER